MKNDTTILAQNSTERIVIEQGTLLNLRRSTAGTLNITGTNQFSLSASLQAFDAGEVGLFHHCGGVGCAPGQETPFRAYWSGFEVGLPNASYRGTHYPVGQGDDDSTIILSVTGHLRTPDAPPNAEDRHTVTVAVPFHFGEGFGYRGKPGEPSGYGLLVGGGVANLTLWWSVVDEGWYFGEADFTFINPHGAAAPSPTEIVLYASDAVTLSGLSLVHDATAAGGRKITSADNGRGWVNTPPAPNDAPYATFAFNVVERGDYRVWLRLRGQGDSKWNRIGMGAVQQRLAQQRAGLPLGQQRRRARQPGGLFWVRHRGVGVAGQFLVAQSVVARAAQRRHADAHRHGA